jgi:SAM-dependent methyltransferase
MNDPSTAHPLFRNWDAYSTIIDRNWMMHQEIQSGVADRLRMLLRPLRVLDLGCGNGWMARQCLAGRSISHYVGVDLSDHAIEQARQMAGVTGWLEGAKADWVVGRMESEVERMGDCCFDVVLTHYALHHLAASRKRSMVQQLAVRMVPGGHWYWSDVFRAEGETREAFLRRIQTEIEGWKDLPESEVQKVIAHIWESDFPESVSQMKSWCDEAGLVMEPSFLQSPFYGAWLIRKPIDVASTIPVGAEEAESTDPDPAACRDNPSWPRR